MKTGRKNRRARISVKILVLVGALFITGIVSVVMGFLCINSMNNKSHKISNECMEAVALMADTSTAIEKVQMPTVQQLSECRIRWMVMVRQKAHSR